MKRAILLAAYGAEGEQNANILQRFEQKVRASFPDAAIRWAFTSMLLRSRLAAAKKKTDSVKKALCRLGFEKFAQVTVQSLHVIPGREYAGMLDEIEEAKCSGAPECVCIGKPLLHSHEDIKLAAAALSQCGPEERNRKDAMLWAGHGTWHAGGRFYSALLHEARKLDENTFLGTLSGKNALAAILAELKEKRIRTVWLMPLLAITGKHATEDLAGDTPTSWRSMLKNNGFECRPILTGAIEYDSLAAIWIKHLQEATDDAVTPINNTLEC